MTIQLELSEDTLARVQDDADRLGIESEEVVRRLIEATYPRPVSASIQRKLDALHRFVSSSPPDTPHLSEYAMSRESMYEHEVLNREERP